MYSHEIDNLIKQHNYSLPSYLYLKICSESPQIREVKYDAWSDNYSIWTDDHFHWSFSVYRKDEIYD